MGVPVHRLLLVDDHAIVREGLLRILAPIVHEWSIDEASNALEALECLRRQTYHMAIVDLSMPGMSGIDLIRRIRIDHPSLAVLVLSMHAEEQYAMRAFKAGANGYVTKDSAGADLVAAVRKVAGGGTFVTAQLAERMVQQVSGQCAAPRHHRLSDREFDILQRIVAGERLTDIAEALHLSIKTISTHKGRILEKLELPGTAALIRYGLEHGIAAESPPTAAGT